MYGAGGVAAGLHLCDSACFFSSLLHELHRLDMEGAPMHAILVMADRRGGQEHDQGRIYKMAALSWQVCIHALFLFFYSIGGFNGKHTMFLLLCSLMVTIQTFWFQKVSSTTLLVTFIKHV